MRGVGRIHLHPVLFCGDPLPSFVVLLLLLRYLRFLIFPSLSGIRDSVLPNFCLVNTRSVSLLPTVSICPQPSPRRLSASGFILRCASAACHSLSWQSVSLGRVPPPNGSETSYSLWTNNWLRLCLLCSIYILHQNILTRWPSNCLVLYRLCDPVSSNPDWNFRGFCVISAPIWLLQNLFLFDEFSPFP